MERQMRENGNQLQISEETAGERSEITQRTSRPVIQGEESSRDEIPEIERGAGFVESIKRKIQEK
jgi:hypothetical protein